MKTENSTVQEIVIYSSNDIMLGNVVVVHCTNEQVFKNVISYLKIYGIKKFKSMKGCCDSKIVYFKKVKIEEITKYLNNMIKENYTVEIKR